MTVLVSLKGNVSIGSVSQMRLKPILLRLTDNDTCVLAMVKASVVGNRLLALTFKLAVNYSIM